MKYIPGSLAALAILASSCGNSTAEEKPGNTPALTAPAVNTVPAPAVPTTANNPQTVTLGTPSQATVSTAALNPAHGQPGHRCDIAVGAPLDSKPAAAMTTTLPINNSSNTATPVVTSQPSTNAISPMAKTAVGLNPAHGQPGHRCDLAVGAPLDSKPVQVEVPIVPADGSNKNIVVNTAPAKPAPGMNPAHGQPGHRCDIAVGAPLPKQ